jgi:hypothetical protein
MRMIIAGSRTITSEADYQSLKQFVMQGAKPDEIVSGGAKGPDLMGERLAAEFGIPVKRFIPDWQNPDGSTNRGAGFIRNGTMAVYASEEPNGELVVLWDGTSAGTTQMMKVATTYGLRVRQVPLSVDTAGLISLRDITPKEPYIFPQSYSSLSVFETCPRQYEAKYLTKEVPYVQTPAAAWGDLAHSHLEQYLKAGGEHQIPGVVPGYEAFGPMNAYQRFADWVLNRAAKRGGTVLAERSAAVDLNHNPVAYKSKTRWIGGKIDVTILYPQECAAEVFDWKGLAIDTPLPTPDGWTTMGAVQVGGTLFDRTGAPCRVVGKSAVKNIECYRVVFDDRSSVVCDMEHLWVLTDATVKQVTSLARGDRVPLAAAVRCDKATHSLDPYVLGLWLADGKHTSGEITKPDPFVWDEIQRRGFSVSHDYSERAGDGKTRVHTVLGLRTRLRRLQVLGQKHVPASYLWSDEQTRLDLLRGIMDGDGHANLLRNQVVLSTTSKAYAEQVCQLALSLGQRATVQSIRTTGFGKTVDAWNAVWGPIGVNPFLTPKKAAKVDAMLARVGEKQPHAGAAKGPRVYRRVRSVERVPTVPTQCIKVDSPDSTFLCTEWFIPTHNTGKVKNDATQLKLYNNFALADYPTINTASAGYIWLAQDSISPPVFSTRDELESNWSVFEHKYAGLKAAYRSGVFPTKPNGLCAKYCDVTSCEHHGRGRR